MDVLSCSHAKRLNDAQLCTCFTCISFHAVVIGFFVFFASFLYICDRFCPFC